MKARFLFIGFCILLMIGALVIIGTALQEDAPEFPETTILTDSTGSIPIEEKDSLALSSRLQCDVT